MIKTKKIATGILVIGAILISSCSESNIHSSTTDEHSSAISMSSQQGISSVQSLEGQRYLDLDGIENIKNINQKLAGQELNIRLAYAETVTHARGAETIEGQTIYANDRMKRLTAQWVPGDERREADGNNLTYLTYGFFATANYGTANELDGETEIDFSMDTWNNVQKNSNLNIVKREDTGANPSYFFDGNPYLADITEFGFLPGFVFDAVLGPGASNSILGVTFTFIFIDEAGIPTDVNNDGYADVAFKEIWYNDAFLWTDSVNPAYGINIETVALHENGHALGLGHFGKVSVTENNNKLHVSPRAVMNAFILGTQLDLLGTDKASYKSIYGNWPKN